ncbi:hypothetical protein BDV97DRAFT_401524 [Delphinella strobiligena]|nr:hypothetical protein BDV97DRAFT_401524 [Delphinella strobiligena]
MADICRSCALRAQRCATSAVKQQFQRRTFTASSTHQKRVGPPVFAETSNPELDDVISSLRNNHFIPAYLNKRQRHLIFGDKYKTELENTPAYATLGDEEVELKHIDRRNDIPARKPLVKKALSLMQGHDDWRQLPGLLEGLHKSNSRPDLDFQEKIVRKAIQADQLGVVVICLNRSDLTGLTLKNEGILNLVIWGLHEYAQSAAWEEARVRKAIRYADEIAQMLEAEEHGTGRKIAQNDPRTRPSTIGVYLELAAVAAQKYQGGKDVDGSVRRYAERLMACINDSNQPAQQDQPVQGRQTEFLAKLSIWHGLQLSNTILGTQLPQSAKAQKIIKDYESRLSHVAQQIQSEAADKPSGYASEALDAWNAVIRP